MSLGFGIQGKYFSIPIATEHATHTISKLVHRCLEQFLTIRMELGTHMFGSLDSNVQISQNAEGTGLDRRDIE
jgi:hypothetical protein